MVRNITGYVYFGPTSILLMWDPI